MHTVRKFRRDENGIASFYRPALPVYEHGTLAGFDVENVIAIMHMNIERGAGLHFDEIDPDLETVHGGADRPDAAANSFQRFSVGIVHRGPFSLQNVPQMLVAYPCAYCRIED